MASEFHIASSMANSANPHPYLRTCPERTSNFRGLSPGHKLVPTRNLPLVLARPLSLERFAFARKRGFASLNRGEVVHSLGCTLSVLCPPYDPTFSLSRAITCSSQIR